MHRCEGSRPGALVQPLLFSGSPAHVTWSVWAVVVDAVKRAAFWARAKYLIEVLQENRRVAPLWAHCDVSRSVVVVCGVGWVVTPVDHVVPAVIAGMAGQPVRTVVEPVGRGPRLRESGRHGPSALHAPARSGSVLAEQRLEQDGDLLPAVAFADRRSPSRPTGVLGGRLLDDDQPPEAVASSDYVLGAHTSFYAKGL